MVNRQKDSTSKKTIFCHFTQQKFYYWKVFSTILNNISQQNCLYKLVFNNVNRLNYSSSMNNTDTSKIKHFPKLSVSGPQIPLKQK